MNDDDPGLSLLQSVAVRWRRDVETNWIYDGTGVKD